LPKHKAMAELDVVRKKKSVFPWVLLGLLLLGLVAYLVWNNTRDNDAAAAPAVTDSTNVVDTTGTTGP
jgi:hypothetical protein